MGEGTEPPTSLYLYGTDGETYHGETYLRENGIGRAEVIDAEPLVLRGGYDNQRDNSGNRAPRDLYLST